MNRLRNWCLLEFFGEVAVECAHFFDEGAATVALAEVRFYFVSLVFIFGGVENVELKYVFVNVSHYLVFVAFWRC